MRLKWQKLKQKGSATIMNRIAAGIILAVLFLAINSCGEKPNDAAKLTSTVIAPSTNIEIGKNNIIWCGTSNLAWQEFQSQVAIDISSAGYKKVNDFFAVDKLSLSDFDPETYVSAFGIGNEIIPELRKEIAAKFPDKDPDSLLLPQSSDQLILYSFLQNKMPFEYTFRRFDSSLAFASQNVECFGIEQYSDDDEAEFYAGEQEKIPHSATLFIPVIDFNLMKSFTELSDVLLSYKYNNKDYEVPIIELKQTIQFHLDEKGAEIESEFIGYQSVGDSLIFDSPFFVLLTYRDAKNPYFSAWIYNSELMMSSEKKPQWGAK